MDKWKLTISDKNLRNRASKNDRKDFIIEASSEEEARRQCQVKYGNRCFMQLSKHDATPLFSWENSEQSTCKKII